MRQKTFSGPLSFCSNFYRAPIHFEGKVYPSVEHAYQAAKTLNLQERDKFRGSISPADAKRLGRKVTLRKDWEDVKLSIMESLVHDKFTRHEELAQQLKDTGNTLLVEGNWWYDNFWGDCSCERCKSIKGQNHLGIILMKIREELNLLYSNAKGE